MLDLKNFQKAMERRLTERLPANARAVATHVKKNNGTVLHGITVSQEERAIAPNIYLEGFYADYRNGRELDDILDEIERELKRLSTVPSEFEEIVERFTDISFVRERVIMVAVNTERNESLLSEVPHRNVEDLSLIYKVVISMDENGTASITVRNEHLSFWKLTPDSLHELARENTPKILPARVKSMKNMLQGFIKDFDNDSAESMYVITNTSQNYGAAVMFYDDVLSEVAETLGGDLAVIPSSIHEVLAVRIDRVPLEMLEEIVHEVNTTVVDDDEILSDSIYRFDSDTKTLTMESSKKNN